MNSRSELQRISALLQGCFNGHAWYGRPLMEILQQTAPEQRMSRLLPSTHTVVELVRHIIAWRRYVLEMLRGNESYSINGPLEDFPPATDAEWENLLEVLQLTQLALLQELELHDDTLLTKPAPQDNYTYYHLLHGLIQHDVYHAGQIALAGKARQQAYRVWN